MFCFFLKSVYTRSIPSSTKEPQVCDSCEVKFEVYCNMYIFGIVLNIYIYTYIHIHAYTFFITMSGLIGLDCPVSMDVEIP